MEEKKSNVFSLRKKSKKAPSSRRAQISNPILKQDKPALPGAKDSPPSEKAHLRPPTGGKTADYVKRRYSTRPGGFQGFDAEAPQVPSIPSIPEHLAAGPKVDRPGTSGRDGPRGQRHDVSVDANALRDPNLRADQYVASILASASEPEIRDYQKNLLKMRNRTSTDLQQNVYQNRTKFIEISREAEKLKGEMRMLRTLMSELKTNTTALNQASVSSNSNSASEAQAQAYAAMTSKARKLDNRSSVANLEAMHNAHLQRLWKEVEGSQRFLPATPGRQVVRESRDWVELNAATWKLGRHVDMCLLNDHLLVAARKKRRVDPSQSTASSSDSSKTIRLVAERCWPLQEIQVVELLADLGPDGANGSQRERNIIANAIKIRVGNDSFTYSKPDPNEKVGLLADYRKAADDLRKANRMQREDKSNVESALNRLTRGDLGLGDSPEASKTLSTQLSKQRPDIMFDVDGKQQNLRWVEGEMDELDINIAVQAFAKAVPSVEKMRKIAKSLKTNAIAQNFINIKTDERADLLADLITRRLVDRHSYLQATQQNINWLVRLNFEDRAREAYLEARSSILRKRTRQCIFEGDLPHYIFQLSFICFTIIRNTISIYQACFPPLMMSACVIWAKEHVDRFNELLTRQLSSFDRNSDIWRECVDTAKQQAELMSEVGLDFKAMVGNVEEEDPDIF